MAKKIRLVIGDHDLFFVESLNSLLKNHEEIEVVGTASECRELALATHQQMPDVAIVGMDLVFADGSELCSPLQAAKPGLGIVFVGNKMDPSTMSDLIFTDG
jgi:two-component system response regulator NreC